MEDFKYPGGFVYYHVSMELYWIVLNLYVVYIKKKFDGK